MPHRILIRNAEADDVKAMHTMLLPYSEKKIVLPRTEDSLFQHLQEFLVADYDGKLVGLAALHVYQANLAEVRSLVVCDSHQGMGVGKLLVEGCERFAASLGIQRLFALTYVDGFFSNMGYQVVAKESLPHKIWTACIHCEKFSSCDEIAVEKRLTVESTESEPILEVNQG
ncbi:MAG TPA: N-acetyltransferase [Mariprofundaceae bacterium]|nr:N-acetyltransferase [Mariprofundaceae bacterium]